MSPSAAAVLALNAGSSSIKFAVHPTGTPSPPSLRGKLDRIGTSRTTLTWRAIGGDFGEAQMASDQPPVHLLQWLDAREEFAAISAVGHRIVHGLSRSEAVRVTPELIEELQSAVPYAPDHLPLELELITAIGKHRRALTPVACFDTAFHQTLPPIARLLPIPRRYLAKGVRRYGFHGLSYAYVMEELARIAGEEAAQGRVILAHLGNGASMAAVRSGLSVDTTMGFTPAAGLPMSTRTGDLDPGLVSFLARTEGLTASQFDHMVNHESGLLGVSETSSDMRELLAHEAEDPRAADAVALFCYQARRYLGAMACALGGVDTLVFSAGIGERSAPVRARICHGMGFLGIELDKARNASHAALISRNGSRVAVHVIPTDEELMIARATCRVLFLDAAHSGT